MKRSFFPFILLILAAGSTGVACGDNEPDSYRAVDGDGDGDGNISCAPSQEQCGDICTSVNSDPEHCGDCDTECGDGEACLAGVCEDFGCGTGQVRCDDQCVNLQADAAFCGDCDTACATDESCQNGQCEASCPSNFLECSGECVDPSRDVEFCGATTCDESGSNGTACESGEVCFEGDCLLGCPGELLACDETCIDPMRNPDYCGATSCDGSGGGGAGGAGSEGEACVGGEVCFEGDCVQNCPEDLLACGGTCIDPDVDRDHCGATTCDESGSNGTACESGAVCLEGACEQSCPEDLLACDDTCVDPMRDRDHCGATTCDEGGSNGDLCISGEVCFEGDCVPNCPEDLLACGGTCINPLSDQQFCGATDCSAPETSGTECGEDEACAIGECKAVQFDWTEGLAIDEPGATTAGNEQAIGADGEGNAIVVWRQYVGAVATANLRVFARRYDAATRTWSVVTRLDTSTETTRNLRMHMNEAGDAVAAWVQGAVGVNSHVFMALFDAGTLTWSSPIQVSEEAGVNETPGIGIDASGNVHAVWSQQVGLAGDFRIARNHYEAGTGFAGEVRIEDYTPDDNSFQPRLVVNEDGDAGAIWWEVLDAGNSTRSNWAVAFDSGTSTWSAPASVLTGPSVWDAMYDGTGRRGDVGIDAAGDVYVVWSQYLLSSSSQDIWMRKFSGSWSAATLVEGVDGSSNSPRHPRIALGPDGSAVVVFTHGPSGAPHTLRSTSVASDLLSFTDGQIASSSPQDPGTQVAQDSSGRSHVVWQDGGQIYTSTSEQGGPWSTPQALTAATGASEPRIAVSSGGRAYASWYQGGDIVFARFD